MWFSLLRFSVLLPSNFASSSFFSLKTTKVRSTFSQSCRRRSFSRLSSFLPWQQTYTNTPMFCAPICYGPRNSLTSYSLLISHFIALWSSWMKNTAIVVNQYRETGFWIFRGYFVLTLKTFCSSRAFVCNFCPFVFMSIFLFISFFEICFIVREHEELRRRASNLPTMYWSPFCFVTLRGYDRQWWGGVVYRLWPWFSVESECVRLRACSNIITIVYPRGFVSYTRISFVNASSFCKVARNCEHLDQWECYA